LPWKMLIYFMAIWFTLWPFGTFCDPLVHFYRFWYVELRKIWQPWCRQGSVIGEGAKLKLSLAEQRIPQIDSHTNPAMCVMKTEYSKRSHSAPPPHTPRPTKNSKSPKLGIIIKKLKINSLERSERTSCLHRTSAVK
jgi:hypothetical protein